MKQDNHDLDAKLPPELLLELLEAARAAAPSGDYREAGELAWQITRLRQEHQRIGFQFEPLESCLTRLADTLAIELRPVLEWFGIGKLTSATPVSSLRKLAHELGIAKEELYVYLARSLANEEHVPVPVAGRGDRLGGAGYLSRCERIVDNLPWDGDGRVKLNRLRREVDLAFSDLDG